MSAYIARCAINPHRRKSRYLLASPQRLHAAVMSSFLPDAWDRYPEHRPLWRLDQTTRGLYLYVTSPLAPDMTHIAEQAGWPSMSDSWKAIDYQPFLDGLKDDQIWNFRLTANPVWNLPAHKQGARGKRQAQIGVKNQENWLLAKSNNAGFCIPEINHEEDESTHLLSVIQQERLRFRKGRNSQDSSTVRLSRVTFEGVLEVTDAARLQQTLLNGLGPGKAYGCGLLTLAPSASQ